MQINQHFRPKSGPDRTAPDVCMVPSAGTTAVRSVAIGDGRDFDRQCGRDPVPDMGEDALPTLAIDAGVVEPAFGGPALR